MNPKSAFTRYSGQGKFILTVTIRHLSDSKDEEGDYRNTGKRRTLIILQSDKAIETHEIIAKLIDLMKFPELNINYTFTNKFGEYFPGRIRTLGNIKLNWRRY